jgi:hypothetical protein
VHIYRERYRKERGREKRDKERNRRQIEKNEEIEEYVESRERD